MYLWLWLVATIQIKNTLTVSLLTGMPQPPRSLIVSKVIGRHGAVLTWHPPNLDDLGRSNGLEIVGYKIFVNRQQKQLVTNAHLTKVGLNMETVWSDSYLHDHSTDYDRMWGPDYFNFFLAMVGSY